MVHRSLLRGRVAPAEWSMVSATSKGDSDPSYALELHIRGLLHLQIEHLPRWLFPTVNTVLFALSAWLLTR